MREFSKDVVKDHVVQALREGEAVVPRDVADPELAQNAADEWITEWGHPGVFAYEPSEAGLKIVRSEEWQGAPLKGLGT